MTRNHRKPDPTPRKGNARTAFPETQGRPPARRSEAAKAKAEPKDGQSATPKPRA